jgi:hypothetical protein
MGLFDFLRKKKKTKTKRKKRSRKSTLKTKQSTEKIEAGIESLQTQIGTMHIALKRHDDELLEHKRLIEEHTKDLEKLEQIVTTVQIAPTIEEKTQSNRPAAMINQLDVTKPPTEVSSHKFDINCFSEQEKRILAVFFQNQQMALSYVDIAKTLNKSPHTVKNQMRQMRLKTDLFDRTVDNDSRNRFKLKDGLKIEKYLNVNH